MIKFLLLAGILYFLYRMFANDFIRKKKENEVQTKEDKERKIAKGEMVKDPQCGAYVSVEDSISIKDGEKKYYFCSYECRDNFLHELEKGGRNLPNIPDRKD